MEGRSDLDSRGGWDLEEGYETLSRFSGHGTLGYFRYDGTGLAELLALQTPQLHEVICARMSYLQTSETSESMRTWEATADPHP